MSAAVLLTNPRFPHNVGAAIRACAVFGAPTMRWTGGRVLDPREDDVGGRLPREERMKAYAKVDWQAMPSMFETRPVEYFARWSVTPVCVEVAENAESLVDFIHPENAVYVFGPEDGGVAKGVRGACHRFVCIPSDGCLNLAAAINVVLYDRAAKVRAGVYA